MAISRKKFINSLMTIGSLGGLMSIIYPIVTYLTPPKLAEAIVHSVKAGKVNNFPPNSSQIIRFGREPVLLIRSASGKFNAFSAVCTHLDCIVQYKNETNQIWCACHNGIYDIEGRNLSGPPPSPLIKFDVKIIQEEIIITRNS